LFWRLFFNDGGIYHSFSANASTHSGTHASTHSGTHSGTVAYATEKLHYKVQYQHLSTWEH
jgi:hypothetical protein